MKLPTIIATFVVAAATGALIPIGAPATPNPDSSKPRGYKLDTGNPHAQKQCIEKGGSVKDGMCLIPSSSGTPGTMKAKTICIVYKPGHEGDDRYCSQSVPAPK